MPANKNLFDFNEKFLSSLIGWKKSKDCKIGTQTGIYKGHKRDVKELK
jgi:hypothetical protein